jgi:hypothetical protein
VCFDDHDQHRTSLYSAHKKMEEKHTLGSDSEVKHDENKFIAKVKLFRRRRDHNTQ